MTHFVLIGLGILIAVLTVVSCFGWLPSLRIVPDDTHFDFTRFRRISFPISAALSIVAITLFFTHGLNFGIDFRGGTLLEVRAKSGTADIAAMRTTLDGLRLGEVQIQQIGGPADVLIRVAEQPGGDAAQQEAVQKGQQPGATPQAPGKTVPATPGATAPTAAPAAQATTREASLKDSTRIAVETPSVTAT